MLGIEFDAGICDGIDCCDSCCCCGCCGKKFVANPFA